MNQKPGKRLKNYFDNHKMDQELSVKNKYYKYFPFKFLVESIIKRRTDKIVSSFKDFIKRGERVLDVGAGGGWISKEIKKTKSTENVLLDIIDFNQTNLDLILYDGEKMPFPNNSFDTVLLICVLHHTEKPEAVLKEAKRVSRNKIIILEDTYNSFFSKTVLCFWDVITNLSSFLIKPFGEKMSFNFKKVSQWQKIFDELSLKIISEEKPKYLKT